MKEKSRLHILVEIYQTVGRFSKKIQQTSISAYSGQAAFMLILSFFPFLMFLLALLRYTPLSEDLLLSSMNSYFPASFRSLIAEIVNGIYRNQSPSILPVTVLTAVWLSSKSFLSLTAGLNSVYEITETRNYFVVRLLSMVYMILFALLVLGSLALLVFGNLLYFELTSHFPILEHFLLQMISLRSLASFVIMLLFFTVMYKTIPNTKLRLADQFPGALLATTGWMAFSFLFSYYVDHISNYASFYGTMTMIALLMIWLYACMYILFFGGLLNYILKEHRIRDYIALLRRN